jgi:hypothetical protein
MGVARSPVSFSAVGADCKNKPPVLPGSMRIGTPRIVEGREGTSYRVSIQSSKGADELWYSLEQSHAELLSGSCVEGLSTEHFEHVSGAGFSAGIDTFCVLADNYYSAGPDRLKLTHLLLNLRIHRAESSTNRGVVRSAELRITRRVPFCWQLDFPIVSRGFGVGRPSGSGARRTLPGRAPCELAGTNRSQYLRAPGGAPWVPPGLRPLRYRSFLGGRGVRMVKE